MVLPDPIGASVQALADFLIDERCHACGRDVEACAHLRLPDEAAAAALARPLEAVRVGPVAIRTRPLCRACVREVHPWTGSVAVTAPTRAGRGRSGAGADVRIFPAFEADSRLLTLIHLLKFARRRRVAAWLAGAMALGTPRDALRRDVGSPVCLVPVPMDRASRRRRGFNQAECIATALARLWTVPAVGDALVKVRRTAPQSSLDRQRRARNLAGAMAAGRGAHRVRGHTALLVDDLVTTGATAAACAGVLLEAGARDVRVVCAGYRP